MLVKCRTRKIQYKVVCHWKIVEVVSTPSQQFQECRCKKLRKLAPFVSEQNILNEVFKLLQHDPAFFQQQKEMLEMLSQNPSFLPLSSNCHTASFGTAFSRR